MELVDDVGPAQQEMSTAAHMHQPIFGLTPTTNMPSGQMMTQATMLVDLIQSILPAAQAWRFQCLLVRVAKGTMGCPSPNSSHRSQGHAERKDGN
jgi:hypothetical protein